MSPCSELERLPYDLEYIKILDFIKRNKVKRVLLQSPPGLKKYMVYLSECMEREADVNVIINLDDSYGGCDLVHDSILKMLSVDLVVHYGHTPYPKDLSSEGGSKAYYLFIPAFSNLKLNEKVIEEVVNIAFKKGLKKLGVVSSLQHVKILNDILKKLREKGIEGLIPEGALPYFLKGQVIGCDYRSALSIKDKVEGYVIISGGSFHALGLYLATRKPVIKADPYENKASDMTKEGERILKLRMYVLFRALNVRRWGIIVGTKTGQYRPMIVDRLTKEMRSKGWDYRLLASESLNKQLIEDIDNEWFQGFVITSCPRLAIDDLGDYPKPVLTPGEARMVLRGKFDNYLFPW